MAFGETGTTQVQDNSCCVIINIMEASLDCKRVDDGSSGTHIYKISGDIVTKAKKHCITGPTIFAASNSLSHRGAMIDCQGGEYPKANKPNEVKPLIQFNCAGTTSKLDMFSAKWVRCAKPCSEDISEIEDCPEFVPPVTAPGWEFTGDPRPKCCCEKETKIPIDFNLTIQQGLRGLTDAIGSVIGVAGKIVTDSEGKNLLQELVPLLKGKLGKEVGCACKEIGRTRDLGMPDMDDEPIGDLFGEIIPGVNSATSIIGSLTTAQTTLRNWNVLPGGGAAEEKDESGKKPTVPPLNHTPCS